MSLKTLPSAVILRLRNLDVRSAEFVLLIMYTFARQIGAIRTQIIAKPVTSFSKRINNSQIANLLSVAQPYVACKLSPRGNII